MSGTGNGGMPGGDASKSVKILLVPLICLKYAERIQRKGLSGAVRGFQVGREE